MLRKEHRLRVSENGVLRGIFEPNCEEVTGGQRRLHSEELHKLYNSDIVKVMRWTGQVTSMGEIGIPERKGLCEDIGIKRRIIL
jgi:hypothetical protein